MWMELFSFLDSQNFISLATLKQRMHEEPLPAEDLWGFLHSGIFGFSQKNEGESPILQLYGQFTHTEAISVEELPALLAHGTKNDEIARLVSLYRATNPKVHRVNACIEEIARAANGELPSSYLVDDDSIVTTLMNACLIRRHAVPHTSSHSVGYDYFVAKYGLSSPSNGLEVEQPIRKTTYSPITKGAIEAGRVSTPLAEPSALQDALLSFLLREWQTAHVGQEPSAVSYDTISRGLPEQILDIVRACEPSITRGDLPSLLGKR
jgi:hypothetical protein